MKRFHLFAICLISLGVTNYELRAQNQQSSIQELETARITRVNNYLQENQVQKIQIGKSGKLYLMYDVVNGKPLFKTSDNIEAAQLVGTSRIQTGGSLGLNLNGEGFQLGVWDNPGGPRDTHTEFEDRITIGNDVNRSDGPSTHSTHVTGTIVGAGINSTAKGMAPKARALVRDFNSDNPEMEEFAASFPSGTAVVSNHSYGTASGWTDDFGWTGDADISEEEDWKFGIYNSDARAWDQIIFNNPYYTVVKSAGNDRGDSGDGSFPADGPYDIISTYGTAKNIITVGAIQKYSSPYTGPSDLQIASFSSWGPTDDGRIKPDIVGIGVGVVSSSAGGDDSYASLQGTSMSSPNVTGSLILLQQLYEKTNKHFMRASTLKALAIQTAYEAGRNPGPDYEYGWGLLNAEAAAKHILEENGQNKVISEILLEDGESYSLELTPEQGTVVKATIVWTDLPGTALSAQLDPEDLALINDLDLRISNSNEEHLPWILNPAVPTSGASKGDNFRDNVEQVEFTASGETYTLNINHKGVLTNDQQRFSLVLNYERSDSPKTYYWIGDDGEWNDPGNWSLSSNGSPVGEIPTAIDQVIIDDNAFSGNDFNLTLDADASANSVKWLAQRSGTFDLGGNKLSLSGDLIFDLQGVNLQNGSIELTGENVVVNGKKSTALVDLIINNNSGSFSFADTTVTNSLRLIAGDLLLNNSQLQASTFNIESSYNGSIQANDASIIITDSFEDNTSNELNATVSNSVISIPEGEQAILDFSSEEFKFELEVLGSLNVLNATRLNGKVAVTGNLSLSEDVIINDLFLQGNSTLNINNEKTLTIAEAFDVASTESDFVSILSNGVASLAVENHLKLCYDFLQLDGVNHIGEATISVGLNSTLTNAQGWIEEICENVLFADFDFENGCAAGLTTFNNLSSGPVVTGIWTIGSNAVNVTGLIGVEVNFEQAGSYPVSLEVTGEGQQSSLITNVDIRENSIEEFDARLTNEVLFSTLVGESYQWFRENQPIANETARQLIPEENGEYKVLVELEGCNRFSSTVAYNITSVEEPSIVEQLEEQLVISPNPTTEEIEIRLEGYQIQSLDIHLTNLNGQEVLGKMYDDVNSDRFVEKLRIPSGQEGMLLLRLVINQDIILNKKVLVIK